MAKTIITIDDAATMRKLIAYTLKGAGYQVLEAPDGPSALSVLADRPVDFCDSYFLSDLAPGESRPRRPASALRRSPLVSLPSPQRPPSS